MSEIHRLRLFNRSTIKLFKLDEKASQPDILLTAILLWTNGQPYLTQKLCQLLSTWEAFITTGEETATVSQVVQTHIINHWQTQIAAEHLLAIQKGLLTNQQCNPILLLNLYRQVLQGQVSFENNPIQTELLNLGLAINLEGKLRVTNPIYQSIFNSHWVEQEIARLQNLSYNTIELFQLDKKATQPDIVLAEILSWTNGQPDLTQILCQLLSESEVFILAGEEATTVNQVVQTNLIDHWETEIIAKHLQTIRSHLLTNQQCHPVSLLKLYQQVLQSKVPFQENPIQLELLNSGLVVQREGKLEVANRIYQSVFHAGWVEQAIAHLQPLSQSTIKLFKLDEKATRPGVLLAEILSWTNAQPELTQILCRLFSESNTLIRADEEAATVKHVVQTYLIDSWETQVAAEHLQAIQARLIHNQQCDPISLLRLYQAVLQGEVSSQDNPVQAELLNLGLVVQTEGELKVANRIYQSVFTLNWVNQELDKHLPLAPTPTKNSQSQPKYRRYFQAISPWHIGILLGVVGLLLVGFSFFKRREVTGLFQQGNVLFNQGKYQQAIAKYNEILKTDRNYYQAWTNRGYAMAGLGDYTSMLESCAAATAIEPKAVYAWNCKGEALHNLKQYDRAITAFDNAIALDSQDPVFWINKTESLLALRQLDTALDVITEATQMLEKATEGKAKETLNRELSVAFSHQGKVLLQKQEYEAALLAYEQALQYAPNYYAAQRGRGLAMRGLRQYSEAVTQFDQMLDNEQMTDAQKAETWYYLGATLCQLSQVKEARLAFEQALTFKHNYLAAEEAKMHCAH